jgi:hypothetical protein
VRGARGSQEGRVQTEIKCRINSVEKWWSSRGFLVGETAFGLNLPTYACVRATLFNILQIKSRLYIRSALLPLVDYPRIAPKVISIAMRVND